MTEPAVDSDAKQYAAQLALSAALIAEVVRLWDMLNFADLSATAPLWLEAMEQLIMGSATEAAEQLVHFYDDYRQDRIGQSLTADVLPDHGFTELDDLASLTLANREQIRRSLVYLGPVNAAYRLRKGWAERTARDTGLVDVSGAAARLALEPARDVVPTVAQLDRHAIGYRRVTGDDPCHFCAMLATRGAIHFGQPAYFYSSRETAGRRNATSERNPSGVRRFVGDGDYKFHDNCKCSVVPVFSADEPLRPKEQAFLDLYERSTADVFGADKLRAFRRAFNAEYPQAPR